MISESVVSALVCFQRTFREVILCFGHHVSWPISRIRCSDNEAANSVARISALSLNFIDFI